jgi:AcrR family transcriptional regulator
MDAMTTLSVNTGAGPERKGAGRPRSAKADEAILHAVLDLLSEGMSVDALSMDAVAAKAGVGKATIYRRWSNKIALLSDAIAAMKGPIPELAGESVRDDLVTLITSNRQKAMAAYGRATACIFPELVRSPEMQAVHHAVTKPRREVFREILRRGIATGELRADLDIEMTVLLLTAPSMAQNMVRFNPDVPEDGFPEALVDAVLRGASAR